MKKVIAINIIVVFLILLFLEIISNFFKLSNLKGIEEGLVDTKNTVHKMIPGSTGIHFGKRIYIDKNGFRVPFKSYNYNKENNSILIIGDSTAFGNGVSEENTFVGKLRNHFKNLNFYNSAVPGYNIKHFKETLFRIDEFDNITQIYYFVTLNDLYDGESIVNINEKKKISIENKKKLSWSKEYIVKLHAYLRNKSYLYMFIVGVVTDPSKRYFKNVFTHYKNKKLDGMVEYVSILQNSAHKKKIKLKIVILPYEYQTRECKSENLIPQKKIKEILINLKINFFDYTKEFCEFNKPKTLFYKFDPMHLSSKGHSFVYNLIINEI